MGRALLKFFASLVNRLPKPLSWLKDVLGGGEQRVHAVVLLLITGTLCLSTLTIVAAILVSVCLRFRQPTLPVPNLSAELAACLAAIGSLAAYIYNRGKTNEEIVLKGGKP